MKWRREFRAAGGLQRAVMCLLESCGVAAGGLQWLVFARQGWGQARCGAGRILLNALIYPGIKMNIQKTSIVSVFHTSGGEDGSSREVVSQVYLLRLKSLEETAKLAEIIKEYAPSA
ncbi:hypothetical protein KSP40_PGU021082 [Platanthera guangdongensis]|uniref:Uncharacterized protein n=1 Tax=Platanthera guangdongensis TaxID=2320717 RepID=A0ABR2MN82_9ASPA